MSLSRHLYSHPDTSQDFALHECVSKHSIAHQGLRFEKFYGHWGKEPNQLLDWLVPSDRENRKIGTSVKLRVGDKTVLSSAAERLSKLAEGRAGLCIDLRLVSRLLTGLGTPHPTENGFLFHPTLGIPYLRGTALKQVARDWATEQGHDTSRLFGALDGDNPGARRIAFLDAIPIEPLTLTGEMITAHYQPYYNGNPEQGPDDPDYEVPADWYDPNPVMTLAVDGQFKKGPVFRVVILPLWRKTDPGTAEDVEQAMAWLTEGLWELGIGAKTTLGYGRLLSEDDFQKTLAEQNKFYQALGTAQALVVAANWKPEEGGRATYDDEAVQILELTGNDARILFLDDNDEILIDDLENLKPPS